MRKPAFCIFCGLCILTSFSLLTVNVRGVSNKHCLLPFFHCICKAKVQISCVVTEQLISTFVFAIIQYFFLKLKFQASCHLLWPDSLDCFGQVGNPEDRFSREMASVVAVDLLNLTQLCPLLVHMKYASDQRQGEYWVRAKQHIHKSGVQIDLIWPMGCIRISILGKIFEFPYLPGVQAKTVLLYA